MLLRLRCPWTPDPGLLLHLLTSQPLWIANPQARKNWKKLSYSHQKQYVDAIEEAKKPETRTERIKRTIEALSKNEKDITNIAGIWYHTKILAYVIFPHTYC